MRHSFTIGVACFYEVGVVGLEDFGDAIVVFGPGKNRVRGKVAQRVFDVGGVNGTTVTLTFDPPWDKDRMSEEAKLALNMF